MDLAVPAPEPKRLVPPNLGDISPITLGYPPLDTIRFACACGQRIKVPHALAGRSILCSKCQASVPIPSEHDSRHVQVKRRTLTQVIRFTCRCGKPIKVPAKYAGKTGTCPQCAARVRVPLPDAGP